jgi:hypothetical protein
MLRTHPAGKGLTACLVPLLIALAAQPSTKAQQPQKQSESADAYEAVVRYQINAWDLAADSYCILIDGRDAPADFLKRFGPLPVRGASKCRKREKVKGLVVVLDKKTGKRSVIFDVETIRWITENEAEVVGGYFCGSFCMAGGRYHVIRNGTHWVVTGYDIGIQS